MHNKEWLEAVDEDEAEEYQDAVALNNAMSSFNIDQEEGEYPEGEYPDGTHPGARLPLRICRAAAPAALDCCTACPVQPQHGRTTGMMQQPLDASQLDDEYEYEAEYAGAQYGGGYGETSQTSDDFDGALSRRAYYASHGINDQADDGCVCD